MALHSMNKMTKIFATAIALVFVAVDISALEAPDRDEMAAAETTFLLRDGVAVGPGKSVVYALETRGLTARRIADGERLWQRGLEQPLGFYGSWLVAFSPERNSAGVLVFLDPLTGDVAERIGLAFPESAHPTIQNLPNQHFSISSRVIDGSLIVDWAQTARPLRGMPVSASGLSPAPSLDNASRSPDALDVTDDGFTRVEGAFRVNPPQASAERIDDRAGLPPRPSFVPDISTAGRAQAAGARSFRASDTGHRLESARTDATEWDRYSWRIFDAQRDEVIGTIDLPWAYAPFFVEDQVLVFLSPPHTRRQTAGDGFVSFGRGLNVVRLPDGQTVWSTTLLEREYRGEQPP